MKKLLILIVSTVLLSFTGKWENSLESAMKIAQTEHKHILLNFSGSDWCGPCIRLRKEIFDSPEFLKLADEKLVLMNADFPRKTKNQLSKTQQDLNDQLAEKYNPKGYFPFTVLLNADGTVIKVWEGFPKPGAEVFIQDINDAMNVAK